MPYSSAQVAELQAERTNDPLARGYAGFTDAQFLTSITTFDIDGVAPSGALFNYLAKETSKDHSSETAATQIYGRVLRVIEAGAAALTTQIFCTDPACSNLTAAGLDACVTLKAIADGDRLSELAQVMTEAKFVTLLELVKDTGVMKPADVTAIQALSQNLQTRAQAIGLPNPILADVQRTS